MSNWWKDAAGGTSSTTQDFFSDTMGGEHTPNQPLMKDHLSQDPRHQEIYQNMQQYYGPFDQHIETSIPDFRNNSIRKQDALMNMGGGSFMDIAGGTGLLTKNLSDMSGGEWSTVALEPNAEMVDYYNSATPQAPNSQVIPEAFGESFEMNGQMIPQHHPGENKYDVVHEAMAFQFIGDDRDSQVAAAKEHLNPGGLFLSDQKFHTDNEAENEAVKDEWKANYYDQQQLERKNQEVGFQGQGPMTDNLAYIDEYEEILRRHFQYVSRYWESGNFAGYAASDDPNTLQRFLEGYQPEGSILEASWWKSAAVADTSFLTDYLDSSQENKFLIDPSGMVYIWNDQTSKAIYNKIIWHPFAYMLITREGQELAPEEEGALQALNVNRKEDRETFDAGKEYSLQFRDEFEQAGWVQGLYDAHGQEFAVFSPTINEAQWQTVMNVLGQVVDDADSCIIMFDNSPYGKVDLFQRGIGAVDQIIQQLKQLSYGVIEGWWKGAIDQQEFGEMWGEDSPTQFMVGDIVKVKDLLHYLPENRGKYPKTEGIIQSIDEKDTTWDGKPLPDGQKSITYWITFPPESGPVPFEAEDDELDYIDSNNDDPLENMWNRSARRKRADSFDDSFGMVEEGPDAFVVLPDGRFKADSRFHSEILKDFGISAQMFMSPSDSPHVRGLRQSAGWHVYSFFPLTPEQANGVRQAFIELGVDDGEVVEFEIEEQIEDSITLEKFNEWISELDFQKEAASEARMSNWWKGAEIQPEEDPMAGVQQDPTQQQDVDHQAALTYNAGENLEGLPDKPINVPGIGQLQFGAHGGIQQLANDYMQQSGIPYDPPRDYLKVDPDMAAQVANEYHNMEHDPQNPDAIASYDQFKKETLDQYNHIVDNGFVFEFYPEDYDPYPNSPREAVLDLHNNNHMFVYPTYDGFGDKSGFEDYPDHPMIEDTGIQWNGKPVTYNDLFRAVHDFYGHAKEGVGFRADGEDNAYRQHSSMYSDLARPSMANEARGQNSWVNYGPHGEANRTATTEGTIFPENKVGLMPDWTYDPDLHRQQPVQASWWKDAAPEFRENDRGNFDLRFDKGEGNFLEPDFRVGDEVEVINTGQKGHIEQTLDVGVYEIMLDDGDHQRFDAEELQPVDEEGPDHGVPSGVERFEGGDPEGQDFESPVTGTGGYIDDDVSDLTPGDQVRCLLTEEGRGQDEYINQVGTVVSGDGGSYQIEVEGLGTTTFARNEIELMPLYFNPHYGEGRETLSWWKGAVSLDDDSYDNFINDAYDLINGPASNLFGIDPADDPVFLEGNRVKKTTHPNLQDDNQAPEGVEGTVLQGGLPYTRTIVQWDNGEEMDISSFEIELATNDPLEELYKNSWWKGAAPTGTDSLFAEDEIETQETSPYLQNINMAYLQENWPMETMVQNILKAYEESTEQEYTAGIEWYNKVHDLAQEFAERYGYTFEQVCAVFARLSPNLYWDTNYVQAIAFIEAHASGSASHWTEVKIWTPYSYEGKPCGYGNNNELAWQILETGDISLVRGEKIESFMHNFINGPDDPDTKATVDIWATRVMFNDPLVEPHINDRDGSYAYMERAYQIAGEQVGLTAKQIQAVTWVSFKNKYGRNRGPTDYVDRFNEWIQTPMEERLPPNKEDLAPRPGENRNQMNLFGAAEDFQINQWWDQERNKLIQDETSELYNAIMDNGGLRTNDDLRTDYRRIPNTFKRRDGLEGDEMADTLSMTHPQLGIHSENDLIEQLNQRFRMGSWWSSAAAVSPEDCMHHLIEAITFLENSAEDKAQEMVFELKSVLEKLEEISSLTHDKSF